MTDMRLRTERLLEMWQDPVIRQKWSQRRSWGQRKDPRHLPWPPGDERRIVYKKLRKLGVKREDALAEAAKMPSLDRQIEKIEARLKALKHLRKSIRSRERMQANLANPAYVAKMTAERRKFHSDPERMEATRQKMRKVLKKSPRAVPWPCGTPQRALYARLLRHQVSRADAIMEASK